MIPNRDEIGFRAAMKCHGNQGPSVRIFFFGISLQKWIGSLLASLLFCLAVPASGSAAERWIEAGYKWAALNDETGRLVEGGVRLARFGAFDLALRLNVLTEGVGSPFDRPHGRLNSLCTPAFWQIMKKVGGGSVCRSTPSPACSDMDGRIRRQVQPGKNKMEAPAKSGAVPENGMMSNDATKAA